MNKQRWLVVVVNVVLALAILAGAYVVWEMGRGPDPILKHVEEREQKINKSNR